MWLNVTFTLANFQKNPQNCRFTANQDIFLVQIFRHKFLGLDASISRIHNNHTFDRWSKIYLYITIFVDRTQLPPFFNVIHSYCFIVSSVLFNLTEIQDEHQTQVTIIQWFKRLWTTRFPRKHFWRLKWLSYEPRYIGELRLRNDLRIIVIISVANDYRPQTSRDN